MTRKLPAQPAQAVSQPTGSLTSLFGGHRAASSRRSSPSGKSLYLWCRPSIFLQSLPDYVAATRCKRSRFPMIYDVQAPRLTSIWVSMLPMLIITVVVMGSVHWLCTLRAAAERAMNVGRAKVKDQVHQGRKAIALPMWPGPDEEKEELAEIVEFLKNQQRFNRWGHASRMACCWWARRAGKRCWPRVRAKRACPSIPFLALIFCGCMWAWALRACATCLKRRKDGAVHCVYR